MCKSDILKSPTETVRNLHKFFTSLAVLHCITAIFGIATGIYYSKLRTFGMDSIVIDVRHQDR